MAAAKTPSPEPVDAKRKPGRPPSPPRARPARDRMQKAGRDPLKLVEAAIITLTEAIDGALPAEIAALMKQLFDALDRRATLVPKPKGAVERARQQWAGRSTDAVPAPAAGGRSRQRGSAG